MSGSGRRTHYRKSVTDDYLNNFPEPGPGEEIARVVASRGSNILDIACLDMSRFTRGPQEEEEEEEGEEGIQEKSPMEGGEGDAEVAALATKVAGVRAGEDGDGVAVNLDSAVSAVSSIDMSEERRAKGEGGDALHHPGASAAGSTRVDTIGDAATRTTEDGDDDVDGCTHEQQQSEDGAPKAEEEEEEEEGEGGGEGLVRCLAILPTRFRKLIWVKRGDFLIVSTATDDYENNTGERGKVRHRVEHILNKDQVKHLRKTKHWPDAFRTAPLGAEEGGERQLQQQKEEQHRQQQEDLMAGGGAAERRKEQQQQQQQEQLVVQQLAADCEDGLGNGGEVYEDDGYSDDDGSIDSLGAEFGRNTNRAAQARLRNEDSGSDGDEEDGEG